MKEEIRQILLKVDKPVRYAGGEVNTIQPKENAALNFLMCFPDVYEVAHSNLGIKILYSILNEQENVSCETCYAVWQDMASALQEKNLPLFSLETQKPMNEFDIVGFSMQYEMSYTAVLRMLELGNVPLFSSERSESDPIVIAGGPCVVNPLPLVPFFDLFSIGDGEDTIAALANLFVECKNNGETKMQYLEKASKIEGVFVPRITTGKVRRAVVSNLDAAYYPEKVQVPNMQAVHNRAVLEVFRGCTRGCRFCQAGMIYRPVRERSVKHLLEIAENLIKNNGFEEISLSSLSTCDYPMLKELLQGLKPITDKYNVAISLPSTRVDSFETEFVAQSRKSSLTFAPEAGTQRLRNVINKNITEEDILSSVQKAFSSGYSSVKLYFMIGLPTETMADIDGIIALVQKIRDTYNRFKSSKKPLSLSVSSATFVPKPFTPFQWARQISVEEIETIQNYLRNKLRPLNVKYSWHDSKTSRVEAVLARGDQSVARAVYRAYKLGSFLDGWNELFDYKRWTDAFEIEGIDVAKFTDGFPLTEELPWELVEAGVSREYLLSELKNALDERTTPDCRQNCNNCGINKQYKTAFKFNCLKTETKPDELKTGELKTETKPETKPDEMKTGELKTETKPDELKADRIKDDTL